jgi:Domain of unknown function (DUF4177)
LATWEYHVETINISDRWSAKRQREEVETFKNYLNKMGSEGWEMVSYESVPLTGHFTGSIKGVRLPDLLQAAEELTIY